MDRLQGVEEYIVLLKEAKKAHKSNYSNLYMMPEDIERYISLGRVEYEKKEDGLFLYFDEENYYKVCMCVEAGETFNISRRDKKILVRNIYRKNEQVQKLEIFEKELKKNGFDLAGTSFQIQGRAEDLLQKCSYLDNYVRSMQKKGFFCIEADYSCYKEIEELILDSDIIKDYQMSYFTEHEKQMLRQGTYLCVLNKYDQICAASICNVDNNGIARDGAIAVKEEYKMKGITPLLSYHRLKWACENKIDLIQGWILTDNDASIKYHKGVGYQETGKYANEWIL